MRLRARREPASPEVDMTPMIDMVFQLIAFFMVAINFAGANQDERIRLPVSELAKPPEVPFVSPVTLQLGKDGLVYFAGESIPVDNLGPSLRREREFIQYRKGNPAETAVIIRADADAQTGLVQQMIKMCQDTGFAKFVLRARQEERT